MSLKTSVILVGLGLMGVLACKKAADNSASSIAPLPAYPPEPLSPVVRLDHPGVPGGFVACDVVIAGGTTAALGAALAAAKEFDDHRAQDLRNLGRARVVCLLEPTEWPGGQMTASGVSAIDFSYHQTKLPNGSVVNTSVLSRSVANNARYFNTILEYLGAAKNGRYEWDPNPGACWVSVRCYEPFSILQPISSALLPFVSSGTLKLFLNTVPKSVVKSGRQILSLTAVRRTRWSRAVPEFTPERRLSAILPDWYDPRNFQHYNKEVLIFKGGKSEKGADLAPVVIDATDWGEVLVLAKASYMQGVEFNEAAPLVGNEQCGQAFVFPLALELKADEVDFPAWWKSTEPMIKRNYHYKITPKGKDSDKQYTWDDVWSYRRSRLGQPASKEIRSGRPIAGIGDITNQNWTSGNDFPYKYLLLSKNDATKQIPNWTGGIDLKALEEAEIHALGWYRYLRENAPRGLGKHIALSDILGTPYGLAKLPYMRDTRRSVAVGDFVLRYGNDLRRGRNFDDTIAIGSYAADVHPTVNAGCSMPAHVAESDPHPAPYSLPFRAHTNRDVDNLLVAGKLMSQTFLANSATRLHPVEFNSGTGVGVAAAVLHRHQIKTPQAVESSAIIREIQLSLSGHLSDDLPAFAPIEWDAPKENRAKPLQ